MSAKHVDEGSVPRRLWRLFTEVSLIMLNVTALLVLLGLSFLLGVVTGLMMLAHLM